MEKKMTKRDYFNKIMSVMANDTEIVEFCKHEIELLDKKKTNGKAKVNETLDKSLDLVYNALAEIGSPCTATELIAKSDLSAIANDLGVVTTQKVSSYLNKLVDSGKVNKVTDKKKTYFSIVED
jgi:tRNA(Ile2) C34 agmatinyltransferase TiaS